MQFVLESVDDSLDVLAEIFDELELIASLVLNRPKCVLIPLWASDVGQVSRELAASYRSWANVAVAYHAKYLGVLIGPTSGERFWDQAISQYLDRAQQWGRLGLGLQFAAVAYKTYVFSTLGFLSQFKSPTPQVFAAESKALSLMVPGPAQWCTMADFLSIKGGMGASFFISQIRRHVPSRSHKTIYF